MSRPATLDHIGIAVRSIEDARGFYQSVLGLEIHGIEDVPGEGLRVAFLPLAPGGAIELLEPTRAGSPVSKFLEKQGPGIHHISFRVGDCREVVRLAEAAGLRVLPPAPRAGAGGALIAFFHPKDTGGVLIEVCERSASSPSDP